MMRVLFLVFSQIGFQKIKLKLRSEHFHTYSGNKHYTTQTCVRPGGGEAQGACPPRLEIKKQNKKVIRENFKLFYLYVATFFSLKYNFICYFLSWVPPLKY